MPNAKDRADNSATRNRKPLVNCELGDKLAWEALRQLVMVDLPMQAQRLENMRERYREATGREMPDIENVAEWKRRAIESRYEPWFGELTPLNVWLWEVSRGERGMSAAGGGTAVSQPAHDDDSYLAPSKLADRFQVPGEALRTRLNRWREHNHAGWMENPDRGPREPQYLYRVGAVRPIIEALRATSGATGERPAKKNQR